MQKKQTLYVSQFSISSLETKHKGTVNVEKLSVKSNWGQLSGERTHTCPAGRSILPAAACTAHGRRTGWQHRGWLEPWWPSFPSTDWRSHPSGRFGRSTCRPPKKQRADKWMGANLWMMVTLRQNWRSRLFQEFTSAHAPSYTSTLVLTHAN